jgi:hypothetical protein
MKLNKATIGLVVIYLLLTATVFAAVQGDTVINVVDPSNALKFTRVVGTQSTGIRTTVMNDITNAVPVSQATATALNVTAYVQQNAQVIASNSSTTNLAALATFTGTSTSTLQVIAIQVSLKTDQNCTVYIEQSQDGTNWDLSDAYYYNKITNNFGLTVQAISSYVRVRVKNLSSTTATTYFRLQTVLCPIGDALPRSLDADGHLNVTLHGLADHYGFTGQFTPMRDLKIAEPVRLAGSVFTAVTDTNFWTVLTSDATATATIADGIATVSSGTTNNGYGTLRTKNTARFVFANPNQYRALIRIPTVATALNTKIFGAVVTSSTATSTPYNGSYFAINASGVLSVNTAINGVVTSVANGSFNGTVSEYTVDTNVHAYEIIYFTAGVWFYIDNVLIHNTVPTNTRLFATLEVPANIISVNAGAGVTSGTVECWNASILRLGKDQTSSTSFYQSGQTAGVTLKLGAGIVHGILVSGVVNNSVVTIYDNTTPLASRTLWSSGAMTNSTVPFQINTRDLTFSTGLAIDITGANANVTIIYE